MNLKRVMVVLGLSAIATTAHAGVIIDNTFVGTTVNTFDAQVEGSVLGLIIETGATYGESLAGQTLATGSGFDVLTGTPSAPLTLQSNAVASDNIGALTFGAAGDRVIYGDLGAAVGEGAVSIRFASGIDGLGFDVVGTDGGAFTVDFFDATGALLASINQGASDAYFGFRATGGDLIAAVSITNTDPAGIGYNNVQFNGAAVPEPASLTLLSLSLAGLALRRRMS